MLTEGNGALVGYKTMVKLAVSMAFVAIVIHKVDMNATVAALRSVDAIFYWTSFLILLLNSLVLAIKFKILMVPSGIQKGLAALFRINLVCRFYAFFLTPAVGQGLIRWFSTTKDQDNRGKFITVMVLERASFFLVLCMAILFLPSATPSSGTAGVQTLINMVAVGGIAAMGILFAYLFSPGVNTIFNQLVGHIPKMGTSSLAQRFLQHGNYFGIYLNLTPILAKCLIITFIWHILYLLRVYLLAVAIGTPLGFLYISWMASLVLLLQTVPITLNGIGLRESAYAVLFSLASLPPEKGVLLGLLFFSQMVIVSAIGGIAAFLDRG